MSSEIDDSLNITLHVLSKDDHETDDVTPPRVFQPGDLDPLVSAHVRDISRVLFECYVQQLIMCLGIPGNILCCVIFVMQGLSDRINLLLFSLAVVDLVNLLCQFIPTLACYIEWWDRLDAINWDNVTTAFLVHLSRWSSFVSGALIVVMSVDRCLSVILPLRAGRILTYRPMLVTILLIYLIILGCHLPQFLVFTVRWTADPLTNRSLAYMTVVDQIMDPSVSKEIVATLTLIIKPIFVIVVIICCIITVISLRQASRKRRTLQERGKRGEGERADSRITQMLLFLCVVYTVLILPELCSSLANYFVPDYIYYGKYHNTFLVVYYIIFTASCLNSSANVCAYLLLSSKFRNTLKSLCGSCVLKQNKVSKGRLHAETAKGT